MFKNHCNPLLLLIETSPKPHPSNPSIIHHSFRFITLLRHLSLLIHSRNRPSGTDNELCWDGRSYCGRQWAVCKLFEWRRIHPSIHPLSSSLCAVCCCGRPRNTSKWWNMKRTTYFPRPSDCYSSVAVAEDDKKSFATTANCCKRGAPPSSSSSSSSSVVGLYISVSPLFAESGLASMIKYVVRFNSRILRSSPRLPCAWYVSGPWLCPSSAL